VKKDDSVWRGCAVAVLDSLAENRFHSFISAGVELNPAEISLSVGKFRVWHRVRYGGYDGT